MPAFHWTRLYQLFDALAELPASQREKFLRRECADDAPLRAELLSLLAAHEREAGPLDQTIVIAPIDDDVALRADKAGDDVGPYRLIRALGRGGMAAVWLAERRDGVPKRTVALKLPRSGWLGGIAERLARERDILARLEHPHIARLYEAGLTATGRPFLALEFIDGLPITSYCESAALAVNDRLELFLSVVEAVEFAHTRFVIHSDLKPSNILVSPDHQVHLLDFGVASLLGVAADPASFAELQGMTVEYASPEQLRHETLSAASDIYSLGVIAFEMLTGELPYPSSGLSADALLRLLDEMPIPIPSRAAPAALRRRLEGDVDAIIRKALSREAGERYSSAAELARDIRAHLQHRAVAARGDGFFYHAGKFIARNQWQSLSAVVAVAALLGGSGIAMWKAHEARVESARATATNRFMIGLFRAVDPRVASERPRGEITAKELLDAGSANIERDFSGQPEVQVQLLDIVGEIYDYMNDDPHAEAVRKRRNEVALRLYGPNHPLVIDGWLDEADRACMMKRYDVAMALLQRSDAPLHATKADQGPVRARWWRIKARVLGNIDAAPGELDHAIEQAVALYASNAPRSSGYAQALSLASFRQTDLGNFAAAERLLESSLRIGEAASDRNDAHLAGDLFNLAGAQERVGKFAEADATYNRASELALRTTGAASSTYWMSMARSAQLAHQRGDRAQAHRLFTTMLAAIPADWSRNDFHWRVRRTYASCLVAEGRAAEAVVLFEQAYSYYLARPASSYSLGDVRRELGDAYDHIGRIAEARPLLQAALTAAVEQEPAGSPWLLRARERWARFLVDHSLDDESARAMAESGFQTLLRETAGRPQAETALAHAGLARVAAARGRIDAALVQSQLALTTLEHVQGLYDLRIQPMVWLVHSSVLRQSGDKAAAQSWAEKALAASRRYDDPASPAVHEALAAVAALARPTATATNSLPAISSR